MASSHAAPAQLVCSAVPAAWAAITTWFSVAGAVSGEQHLLVLLTGAAAAAAAVVAAVLLAKGLWSVGLGLLAAAGLGPGGTLATAAAVAFAAGLVCLMAVLLDPPGVSHPPREERQ